jgi:hypothetical protein
VIDVVSGANYYAEGPSFTYLQLLKSNVTGIHGGGKLITGGLMTDDGLMIGSLGFCCCCCCCFGPLKFKSKTGGCSDFG